MAMELGLALAVIMVLLAGVALARRGLAAGTRRNVLSVALVLLGFAAAFVVCFGGGFLVHRLRSEAQKQGDALPFAPPAVVVAARG